MRNRDRVGLNAAPLFLRLMLGLIFLQAGLGKLIATMPVDAADEPILAAMGASITPAPAAAPATEGQPAPEARPRVRKLYGISLRIYKSANPAPLEGGGKVRAIWPPDLATGGWPRYLGWGTALTEALAGLLLLAGFATRAAAFALAGVMLGAMWLTELGPAVQSGDTMLGIFPSYTFSDPAQWRGLWLQFALLMSSAALMFLGPGRLSLDNFLLGGGGGDEDE